MSFPYIAALSWRATATEYASTKTFNTGQMGMTEDGSLWRLCKAGGALVYHSRAVINYFTAMGNGIAGEAIQAPLKAAIAAGDTDFTITDATNARAADYYKGGYAIQPRTEGDNIRYIWKSSGEDIADTYKIYVTAPFTATDALGNTIHVYPCPWGDVRVPTSYSSQYEHFVCVPAFAGVTSGKYFWGHVRGPHWCGQTGSWPGAGIADRQVAWHSNGTIVLINDYWPTYSNQIAGYLMFSGNYGDNLIYLQIE